MSDSHQYPLNLCLITPRRYWIGGGGDRVSVYFAVTFLDCRRTRFCVTNNNNKDCKNRGGYRFREGRSPPLRFRGKKWECSQFDKSYVLFNFKLFDYFLFNGNIIIKGRKKYFSSLLKINITNDVSIRRHCVLFYWC